MAEVKITPPEKAYYRVAVEEGEICFWCSCGLSKNQPFCDGSHKGTDKTPIMYKAKKSKDIALCGCRLTKTPPLCDGSHKKI